MKFNSEKGTLARRKELQRKREALEAQITNTADPKAAAELRKDYREIINELETYYNDIPEGTK
jgi:cell division protein FtsB